MLQPGLACRRLAALHAGMQVSCGLVGVPTTLLAVADVVDADPSAVPINSQPASRSYSAVDGAIKT